MATAYPEDDLATPYPGDMNHNIIRKDSTHLENDNDGYEESDEVLTAEFRHQIGLLDDDTDALTDAFKARLGLLGSEGMNEVAEMEIALEEEKDQTLNLHKFSKFAKQNIKKSTGVWSKDHLHSPLLAKKQDVDKLASMAVWLAVLRFMGDIPTPEIEERKICPVFWDMYLKNDIIAKQQNSVYSKLESEQLLYRSSRTPVMTKVFRTLEAHAGKRGRTSSSSSESDVKENRESFKVEKRSSWKKVFSSRSSEKRKEKEKEDLSRRSSTKSTGSISSREIEYSADTEAMLQSIPCNELDLVHFVVGHGILRKELRDEIFCQLCKQVTKNPNKESEKRGWMLHALCAGCFVPSESFMLTYRSFLRDAPDEFKSYARYTRRIIRQTSQNGMRYHPPNWLEYQACKLRKYVMLPITCADRRVETVEADSATTAAEMCSALATKLNLKDHFGFSVYICIYDKVSSLGSGMDHVMDAISECEQVVRSKGRKEEDAPWRLYYRKEMFTPWHDPRFDDTSTGLIYSQVAGGSKSEEYRFKNDEELAKLVAQRWFIDHGAEIVPGKVQQELQKYLPPSALNGSKNRDGWTNAIIAAFDELGLNKDNSGKTAISVKQDIVFMAMNKWPLQFSGLFEAFKISGPKLNKNDIVLAVSSAGLFILDEPYKVSKFYRYYEIVEVFASRSSKNRGQSLSMVTVAGEEYTFISPNAETVTSLVKNFLDGLRKRARYGVGLQNFSIKADGSSEPFSFRQGDVLELRDEEDPGVKRDDWCYGRNMRTAVKGPFPYDIIYVLPAIRKPPDEFLKCFSLMNQNNMDTLPRNRKGIQFGKGTVGRSALHGKDSAA